MIKFYRLTFLLILIPFIAAAQNKINIKNIDPVKEKFKGWEIVCPGIDEEAFSVIPAPGKISNLRTKNIQEEEKKSEFIVTYFDFPEDAKEAFERAVEIWERLIYSKVPIRVEAHWQELGSNILGSASPSDFEIDFPGSKFVNTFYPIALGEKVAGKPINSDEEFDIFCRFNKKINWHFGEPKDITASRFDFTSVVLHELAHGLGFFSTLSVTGSNGYYGDGGDLKVVYDLFVEDNKGQRLVDKDIFKNVSPQLYDLLTSDDLYYAHREEFDRAKLFAPKEFMDGSSISHLDDNTYPPGDLNNLMTSTVRYRQVNHNPGPLVLGMFYEMGWKGSSIVHKQFKNEQEVIKKNFVASLNSDTTLTGTEMKIVYYVDNANSAQELAMQRIENTDEFAVELNFPENSKDFRYFFVAKDAYGDTIKSPGTVGDIQYVYHFQFGKDQVSPRIYHEPLQIEDISYPIDIIAYTEDDYAGGVTSVKLKYQINAGAFKEVDLQKFSSEGDEAEIFFLLDAINGLQVGDLVKYRLIAEDAAGNITVLPTEYTGDSFNVPPVESYYEFTVTGFKMPVESYSTDFESVRDDFALLGFKIDQESGFPDKALHSDHPYRNGLGLIDPFSASGRPMIAFEREIIAMLRKPIILGTGNTNTITFDEVVLVEPGETDSEFGFDGFYDYVVVEGTLDGVNWFPLDDGYDSNAHSVWKQKFEEEVSGGDGLNSLSKGSVLLSKKRIINISSILNSDYDGYSMAIRFVLYSDQLANGWGWSIDNLYIQEKPPVFLANEIDVVENKLILAPNPADTHLDIKWETRSGDGVKIEVYSIDGKRVFEKTVPEADKIFRYRLNTSSYVTGTYILKLSNSSGVAVKRFIKL